MGSSKRRSALPVGVALMLLRRQARRAKTTTYSVSRKAKKKEDASRAFPSVNMLLVRRACYHLNQPLSHLLRLRP